MIGVRNQITGDVAYSATIADACFQGLKFAIRDLSPPFASGVMKNIEMKMVNLRLETVINHSIADKRNIKRQTVKSGKNRKIGEYFIEIMQ